MTGFEFAPGQRELAPRLTGCRGQPWDSIGATVTDASGSNVHAAIRIGRPDSDGSAQVVVGTPHLAPGRYAMTFKGRRAESDGAVPHHAALEVASPSSKGRLEVVRPDGSEPPTSGLEVWNGVLSRRRVRIARWAVVCRWSPYESAGMVVRLVVGPKPSTSLAEMLGAGSSMVPMSHCSTRRDRFRWSDGKDPA